MNGRDTEPRGTSYPSDRRGCQINPLTYGIDGLRGTLTGSSSFPLLIDLALMLLSTIIMISIASYAFSKTEPS